MEKLYRTKIGAVWDIYRDSLKTRRPDESKGDYRFRKGFYLAFAPAVLWCYWNYPLSLLSDLEKLPLTDYE